VVRWLLVLALSLASGRVFAQNDLRLVPGTRLALAPRAPEAGRFAHAAAITGVVSAVLLLGGAIAIAAVDDPDSERITRGVHLGLTALAPPLVALGAYSARRGSVVLEGRRVRGLGWAAYAGAIGGGVGQWYGAFHDTQASPALTITVGALGAIAVLAQAWDAYLCARHARLRSLRLGFSPRGLALRF